MLRNIEYNVLGGNIYPIIWTINTLQYSHFPEHSKYSPVQIELPIYLKDSLKFEIFEFKCSSSPICQCKGKQRGEKNTRLSAA